MRTGDRARERADPGVAPAHPHRGADLRVPPRPPGRRRCTARPGSSGVRRADRDLAECCDRWAELPLVFEPGSRWNYSVATDVLGRLVEVVSGQTPRRVLRRADLRTARHGRHRVLRCARTIWPGWPRCTCPSPGTREILRYDAMGAADHEAAGVPLRRRRARVDRPRLPPLRRDAPAGRRARRRAAARPPHASATWATNHLPGGVDLEAFGQSTFAETTFDGVGFGLGFAVVQDPAATKVLSSAGEIVVGRRRFDRLLRRPARGHHRGVPHPAAAVEHLQPSVPSSSRCCTRLWSCVIEAL